MTKKRISEAVYVWLCLKIGTPQQVAIRRGWVEVGEKDSDLRIQTWTWCSGQITMQCSGTFLSLSFIIHWEMYWFSVTFKIIKQDKVTTAQYCILRVKKKENSQTWTHTPIHTRFSNSVNSGVNLWWRKIQYIYLTSGIVHGGSLTDSFKPTCSFHSYSIKLPFRNYHTYQSETLWGRGFTLILCVILSYKFLFTV